MKRYSPENDQAIHDLLIVGGGIYGASMAYTASLNGLKTLLVEKDDFCQHTSANSQKVIHGGLRYLQTLDIKRVIESIREKQRFYHLFPHQVKPLPCLLPTSGYAMKGNEAFRAAFLMYGLIQKLVCRGKLNKNLDKRPQILSKAEVVERFAHTESADIRGGALWYDGICDDPERVILALLKSSDRLGGKIANHMKVVSITRIQEDTLAVTLRDRLSNKQYTVLTRKIALCTGSWLSDAFGLGEIPQDLKKLSLIRGMNVIVPSLFSSATSFATKVIQGASSRFLFIVPWKDFSIEGTHWEDADNNPLEWPEHKNRAEEFHATSQKAISGNQYQSSIRSTHVGYVPGVREGKPEAADRILGQYKLIDREKEKKGDIIQVVGVKFTTAFDVVKKTLQQLFPESNIGDVLKFNALPHGSPAQEPSEIFRKYCHKFGQILTQEQCRTLFTLFGTAAPDVIKTLLPLQEDKKQLTDEQMYLGLTSYCVHNEMVQKLDDLIYRRIFPDCASSLPTELINILAGEMANLLHWSIERKREEISKVINKQKMWL